MKVFLAILVLSVMAYGQDCGNSWNVIRIIDNKEKAIDGAAIKLSRAFEADPAVNTPNIVWDAEKHVFSMVLATCGSYTVANLSVNADGYEPIVRQIKLPLNSKEKVQRFVAKLRRLGTKEGASIDTLTFLTGTIYDPNGAVVPGVAISAEDTGKRVFGARTNLKGDYSMELPVGLYDISINKERNFKFWLVRDFFVAPPLNKPMKLDYVIYR